MKTRVVALALGGALLAAIVGSAVIGAADLSVADVWQSVLHHLGLAGAGPSPIRDAIVWELRLPRILTAAGVGAGLALSGAVMQAVTRNPLADPFLLGLSAGASLGAVAVLVLGVTVLLAPAAFLGALAALVATLVIARSTGSLTPPRTVLAGVAVSSLAAAITSLVIFWTASGDSYREILGWLLGSLAGARWPAVAIAIGALVVIGGPLMLTGRTLDAFAFGETAAASLGVSVNRTRWLLLVATALLTGARVSVSGSIGFVGLVLPHAIRLLVGSANRRVLPLSALLGAVFLVLADTVARSAFDPRELPVGIVTAIVGAPLFVLLLARRRVRA
jgi:iron complex transport system permease protein